MDQCAQLIPSKYGITVSDENKQRTVKLEAVSPKGILKELIEYMEQRAGSSLVSGYLQTYKWRAHKFSYMWVDYGVNSHVTYSAEIRWFFGQEISQETCEWFGTNHLPAPETRPDHYLFLPGCETVGIKLRGGGKKNGNFEVKAMKGVPEIASFGTSVTGRFDCWLKWSNSDDEAQPWINTLSSKQNTGESWVRVDKKRWLRKVSLDSGQLREVGGEYPNEGCNIELTQLKVNEASFWSIGLETFGTPKLVRHHLQVVTEWFFQTYPIHSPLQINNSYAYPTWLNTLPGT